ncbi:MAG TPA: EAL domain-containing protein [Actinomycetes bacterium]|nr:EAL domain-containing protein [Actinomycetes bacterium]
MTTSTGEAAKASAAPDLPDHDECRALVTSALHNGAPTMVAQPILGLSSARVVAYEALARFGNELPSYSPDIWFAMAHRCGLGAMFEARAVDIAVRAGETRPVGTLLSVNVSPSVLSSRELHDVLPFDLSSLQFEITEQQVVQDTDQFARVVAALRDRGARIAVDDVGEGYAGLQRVLSLSPDLIKLDRSLVAGVESQPVKAALVEAIVRYAAKVGAEVCAEGVENLDDLYVLADLDVAEAQGWVIGMPSQDFEPATEASTLTCMSSYQRTLALGSRAPGQDATALERLLAELVACSDLDHLARMTGPIADHLNCDLAEISFLDADQEFLQGIGALAWRPEGHRYPLADFPLTRRCLETLEIMTVDITHPDADPAERSWMTVEGVTTMIGLPVVAAGKAVGLLECSRSEPLPWTRLQLRHARIIATVLGPVISSLSRE